MTAAVAQRAPSPELDDGGQLPALLEPFTAPSEALLTGRELLRRVDSKFVVTTGDIPALVAGLEHDYAAFRVETGPIAAYHSLYLDTPDLVCFHDHRRGKRLRHKVRIRHYPDRSLSFLEIKSKQNELITHKRRIELPFGSEALGPEQLAFLRMYVGDMADQLRPELRVNYRRIGLLGLTVDERVTIDLELDFVSLNGETYRMSDAAVIEVKQITASKSSPIMRRLVSRGKREQSLSKYTTAIATTRPEVRKNRLLVDLKRVDRILKSV